MSKMYADAAASVGIPRSMVAHDYSEIVDGPVYVTSERLVTLIRPLIPDARDRAAEFHRQLSKEVAGVGVVREPFPSSRYFTTDGRDASERHLLFSAADLPAEAVASVTP